MRIGTASIVALTFGLVACSQAESKTQAPEPIVESKAVEVQLAEQPKPVETTPVSQVAQIDSVDDLLERVMSDTEEKARVDARQDPHIDCSGVFQQGGAALCKTFPGRSVEVSGIPITADEDGYFIVGFDRDARDTEIIQATIDGKRVLANTLKIAPREYDVQRIDGLPPSQVSTFTDKQLAHIKASSARKKVGFSSRSQDMGFRDGFTMAVSGTKSSDFGNQRILNGEAKRPHYGVDIAAPEGTPIYAPADGVISLADDDLYFEGAMVLIDHGQGLISMYLHMSDIDVEAGQKVKRGDQIGAVGAKGRATGPHLCWRLKWRNRNLDPELLTQWPHD